MNTPAHLLIGLAVCARKTAPKSARFAALGSLIPDLSLYVMAGVSLFILQIPPQRVFEELYFSDAWQAVFAIDNSFILWGLALAAGLYFRSVATVALTSAALLHLVLDFPLHHDDARQQFWPLTNWVFESPLSYWDSNHHAATVAPIGLLMVIAAAVVVWRRYENWWSRAGVLAICAIELWVVRQWLLFF